MTISTIDELKNDIINRLKNRNINDLKSFIMYHNVNLKEIEKYGYDDLLYLAIKEDNPKEVINYIVKECQYDTVNYVIDSNSSTPIGLAVARSNFEVADLLYNEYNADINFGESLNKCLPFAYKNGNFSLEQLTYLLDRGYDKNGILEETIKLMVTSFHNNHIKLIWDHYIYDSSFIIKVLEKRKGRRVYSSSEWEKILSEEKQKLHITDSLYETAFENKNWEALQIFLNYDGRDQKVPIFDMIEENEIIERAIDSEDLPTIQAISNYGYALNYKTFNFEELIMKAYSKVNKDIWKLLIKSSLLSFQKKEEKLIECFNSNLRRSMILENDIPENLNVDLSMRETGTRKIKRNLNSIIEGKEEGHGIDDDNFIENDITNNIVRKEDDGLNYTIKNLSISNNTTRIPITNSNSKSYLGYDTYKRSSGLDESFLTGGEASREFMTNISPIVRSSNRDFVGESPFINEPSQNFIDDDSKLLFPRLNTDLITSSPLLTFNRINQNQDINNNNNNNNSNNNYIFNYNNNSNNNNNNNNNNMNNMDYLNNLNNMNFKPNDNPSLAFDPINQNITITSPPIEVHKSKNYYLYLIQEIIKENHYNSSFLLNMAIRWHCDPLIKYLIDGDSKFKPRIDVNVKDINGNYPLITFIRSDRFSHLNLLLYLLEKGANPNVKDGNGYSPLMLSIQKEFEMGENIQDSYVKILIEHGASVNERDANGNSLLSLAVQKNSIRMVDFFLKSGCPMNEKDASGNYPIMVAISQNQYEIVKLFMRYGKKNHQLKNFCIRDINGNTPLTLAYKLRLDSIFKYLLKYLNINDTDAQGKTLLFHALERNDTKVVKYLVQVGAEVNQEDNLGNSPLIYAIKRGSLFLVQKLVEHGANINVKDRSGTPSLIIAYDYQKMDIFKYLVEHNVTINENFTENEINSIFFRIIIDKNISSLKYIIKYGANVNCFIGSLRSTPLMYACLFNDMSIVKCLVESNANLNIDNTQGNTALAYAISKHNLELVNYLIDHGADIYHQNNEGKSIYNIAYENCKHDIVQGEVININEKTKIYQKINYLYHE